jgi:hypothetical protein
LDNLKSLSNLFIQFSSKILSFNLAGNFQKKKKKKKKQLGTVLQPRHFLLMSAVGIKTIPKNIPKRVNFKIKIHRLAKLTADNHANLLSTGVIFSRNEQNSILACYSILANALALKTDSVKRAFRRNGFSLIHHEDPTPELGCLAPAMAASGRKWKKFRYMEGRFDSETTELELPRSSRDMPADHGGGVPKGPVEPEPEAEPEPQTDLKFPESSDAWWELGFD